MFYWSCSQTFTTFGRSTSYMCSDVTTCRHTNLSAYLPKISFLPLPVLILIHFTECYIQRKVMPDWILKRKKDVKLSSESITLSLGHQLFNAYFFICAAILEGKWIWNQTTLDHLALGQLHTNHRYQETKIFLFKGGRKLLGVCTWLVARGAYLDNKRSPYKHTACYCLLFLVFVWTIKHSGSLRCYSTKSCWKLPFYQPKWPTLLLWCNLCCNVKLM